MKYLLIIFTLTYKGSPVSTYAIISSSVKSPMNTLVFSVNCTTFGPIFNVTPVYTMCGLPDKLK